jgi:hypothetical protein
MTAQATSQLLKELADFQQSMDEFRLIKEISKDLHTYKAMLQVIKFD